MGNLEDMTNTQDLVAPNPPTQSGYKLSNDPETSCGSCAHRMGEKCAIWNARIDNSMVCNRWGKGRSNRAKILEPKDTLYRQEDLLPKFALSEMYLDGDVEKGEDGLFWKEILPVGRWELTPGDSGSKKHRPMEIFDGSGTVVSEEKYSIGLDDVLEDWDRHQVTVPDTHDNGPMNNKGFVKKLVKKIDSKGRKALFAGIEFKDSDARKMAEEGSLPGTSAGLLFNYMDNETGDRKPVVLEHVALTGKPWIKGMDPFSMALSEDDIVGMQYVEEDFDDFEDFEEELEMGESKGFVPPQSVRSAAKRGIQMHKDGKSGDGLYPSTVTRAQKIASGQALTLEHVKRMHAFFSRHTGTRPKDGGKGDSPWKTAWLLWGGDAGRSWAASIVKQQSKPAKANLAEQEKCACWEKTGKKPEKMCDKCPLAEKKADLAEGKKCNCWKGYERVPGTKPCAPGSCRKCDEYRKKGKKKMDLSEMLYAGESVDERKLRDAQASRRLRLSYDRREENNNASKGGEFMENEMTHVEEEIVGFSEEDRVDLSEAQSVIARQQEQIDKLQEQVKMSSVKERIEELKKVGLSEYPGFLKEVEKLMLADDGGEALLLSESVEGENVTSTLTATEIVDRLIAALPTDEDGNVKIAAQHVKVDLGEDGGRPPVDTSAELSHDDKVGAAAEWLGGKVGQQFRSNGA